MHDSGWRVVGTALAVVFSTTACASAIPHSGSAGVQSASSGEPILTPAAQAAADSGRPRYTRADVEFMHGMIRHHAQALVMAALAPTQAARPDVKTLAGRIDVAQRDEIALMERWLRERRETVPEPHAHANMPGHQMPLMPGMLTAEQLAQLERARGPEFDRLFLAFMIQHHEGALAMLEQLFATPGAGQDPVIFRFASDVEADQTTEIDRMRSMLALQPNQP
jgi:uncharacterized protein (DUF305 family)